MVSVSFELTIMLDVLAGAFILYSFPIQFKSSYNLHLFSRDVDLTEKLDYSSGVALLGYSLILAIMRTFSVRVEAARVMIAAPIVAFVTTHILYLNFYQFDNGNSTLRKSLLIKRYLTTILVSKMFFSD